MNRFEQLRNHTTSLAVIGLGYIGLPLAIALAEKYNVIGFDVDEEKINSYRDGVDSTNEVGDMILQKTTMTFTSDITNLYGCTWFIIAVPTPIHKDKTPNLSVLMTASKMVAAILKPGDIVVYESTVYPGTTEELSIPILEEHSDLRHGEDFAVGYSPERINPGDKLNTLQHITKVVSAADVETLEAISALYGSIITKGIHRAPSIPIAEAAKIVENAQRDINIAFTNELAIIFEKMGIHTQSVLEAARTKWNFLDFRPGLVGGHCIGVDPYYFTYKAEQLGYHSQIILAGRKINDGMGKYIANQTVKKMIQSKQHIAGGKVAILGITFKENVADIRNSKVMDIIWELEDYGLEVIVHDPIADANTVQSTFSIPLVNVDELDNVDCIVLAVPHQIFKQTYDLNLFESWYRNATKVFVDVKSVYNKDMLESAGYVYWSL